MAESAHRRTGKIARYNCTLRAIITLACFSSAGCVHVAGSVKTTARSIASGYHRMTELYPSTSELSQISCLNPPLDQEKKACGVCEKSLNNIESDTGTTGGQSCPMSAALSCAENTRIVDEDFLMCREKRQLIVGTGIALLAAGAGGAAIAGSTIVAVATGSIAGAGLGLDAATYNSSKSSAFGTAAGALDCIVRKTLPAQEALKDIDNTFANFENVSISCPSGTTASSTAALYEAEKNIAQSQKDAAHKQLDSFGFNVFAATRTAQIAAFVGSQNGIPTPTQIQTAIQNMSISLPTPTVPKAEEAACKLPEAESAAIAFHVALSHFQLPDPMFQQCLSANTGNGGSSSAATKNVGNGGTSQGNGGSPDGGGTQGGGGSQSGNGSQSSGNQSSGGSQPFTVQPATNSTVCVNNKNQDAGATLQVTGGTPPYYFAAVDLGVTVSAPEVRLDKGDAKGGRVLVGDQAGSQQVIYVTSSIPTVCPTPTPPAAGH
jgi:hypothetical protein